MTIFICVGRQMTTSQPWTEVTCCSAISAIVTCHSAECANIPTVQRDNHRHSSHSAPYGQCSPWIPTVQPLVSVEWSPVFTWLQPGTWLHPAHRAPELINARSLAPAPVALQPPFWLLYITVAAKILHHGECLINYLISIKFIVLNVSSKRFLSTCSHHH